MLYQNVELTNLPGAGAGKKILITGASGFIGSFLVEEALRHGYTVYAGMRPGSKMDFLQHASLRRLQLDLSSPELLEQRFKYFNRTEGGFDYIIHNAGITRARRKEDFHRVNDRYTRHLANAVQRAGRLPEKFIFISSLAACGPGEALHFTPIRLSDTEHPLSAYAKSKLSAERHLRSLDGFPYIIVRPTAVFGPRDKDFLPLFRLLNKGLHPLIGRHPQRLSLIYVKDLAVAICRMLESGQTRTSWLVSDGMVYSKEALGNALRKVLDRQTMKVRLPLLPIRAAVFGMEKMYSLFGSMPFLHLEKLKEMAAPNWSCDSQPTWETLGIQPSYTLESGLRETACWYKEHGWLH